MSRSTHMAMLGSLKPLTPISERRAAVLVILRTHGGWMSGKEVGGFFDWGWQTGYSTMQTLVKDGLVEKRLTDEVALWGRRVPEYRAAP